MPQRENHDLKSTGCILCFFAGYLKNNPYSFKARASRGGDLPLVPMAKRKKTISVSVVWGVLGGISEEYVFDPQRK